MSLTKALFCPVTQFGGIAKSAGANILHLQLECELWDCHIRFIIGPKWRKRGSFQVNLFSLLNILQADTILNQLLGTWK